jgi:hypothetical protein
MNVRFMILPLAVEAAESTRTPIILGEQKVTATVGVVYRAG